MESSDVDKTNGSEEGTLSRNRSFKSKQLVRSQAIRESQSPPRTSSPSVVVDAPEIDKIERVDKSSEGSDVNSEEGRRQQVEIQITQGAWDESPTEQRQRTNRWLGNKQNSSRDLLSNNPRVACVCGSCTACPHCRGRRRRHLCSTKQDSGIVCSDECPDCSDSEATGGSNNPDNRRANSLDVDDQTPYCRCPERKEKPKSISLSRTDSDDKSEPTGPELVSFIKETLNKNARDRITLLRIEKELHALITDTGRCIVRFPVMTSYGRMLVHRCAALFQLSHHLDHTNKNSVLVSKSGTSGGRIPCTSFKEWCTATFPPSPQRHDHHSNAKSILKRDTQSLDEPGAGALSASRSKSLEQREREYERVRRRIFSSDNCTSQDESSQWQWLNSGPIKLLTPEGGRNKLLKVQSLEGSGSTSTANSTTRGPVSKSHSFGGYGRTPQDPPRLLSRQGDLASSSWRLSPSSSGYRTLSLHSTDSVTPSPTGGASPEPSAQPDNMAVVWCVTDLAAVPAGALVIHPQTGRPLTNPDGSVYHFDPANPPLLAAADADSFVQQHTVDANNEKKRGRLEKQHSFIDNECECQPSEECRSKCCCESRRPDPCHRSLDKSTPQPEQQKVQQKPPSPCKNRYDKPPTPTNHNPPPDLATNHRPYEPPTNPKPPETTNQHQVYESQTYLQNPALRIQNSNSFEMRNPYENRERFEMQRPPSYDANQKFEVTNQRVVELANHRPMKLPTPEVQYIGQQFQQTFSHDEMTTPPQMAPQYYQQDMTQMAQLKPMHIQDPNMRPMVVYGAGMTSSPLPVYGALLPTPEEKHEHNPVYQYQGLDYSCGSCIEPAAVQQRPYALYTPDTLKYAPHQPYPTHTYQEPIQWQNVQPALIPAAAQPKLFVPEMYPIMQRPPHYAPYNIIYPQMIPQPYPVCQPVYPVAEKPAPFIDQRRNSFTNSQRQSKRNSISGSSRNTPLTTITSTEEKVPYEENQSSNTQNIPTSQAQVNTQTHSQVSLRNQSQNQCQSQNVAGQSQIAPQNQSRDSNEIAAKIQQIKEQMAQLNTRERRGDKRGGRDDWGRRNSGHGILGNYPLLGRPNEEAQLSSAARAIVNSIRNMQAKNSYQDRRPDYHNQYRYDKDRPDFRRRDDKPDRSRTGPDDRRLPIYRPSYLLRQMSPGTWCRRSPAPVHPVLNNPRRPPPDNRNPRR